MIIKSKTTESSVAPRATRSRASSLRAARAVTLGLGITGAACSTSPGGGTDGATGGDLSASSSDMSVTGPDLAMMPDLAAASDMTNQPDLTRPYDMALGPDLAGGRDSICAIGGDPSTDPDCCDDIGGFWDPQGGCAIPGPFTPPALDHVAQA